MSTGQVCGRGQHQWDEGDNEAIYCGICGGYTCDTCAATGIVDFRSCWACDGSGVVVWLESAQAFVGPNSVTDPSGGQYRGGAR
jgi:hypothetical protein